MVVGVNDGCEWSLKVWAVNGGYGVVGICVCGCEWEFWLWQ